MSSNAVTGALVTLPNRNVLTIGLLRHLVALERWVLDPSRLGLSSAWAERFTYQGVRPHRGPEPRLAQGTARGATESGPSSSSRNGRAPWDWWQRWYRVNPDPPWRLPLAAALASLVASVSVSSAEEVWDLGRAADAAQKALVAAEEEIRRQGGGSFPAGGAAAEQQPEVIPDTKSGQLRIRIPLPPDVVPRLLLHRLEQAFHRVPGCHGFVAQTTSDLHGSTTLLHTGSAVRFGSPAGSVAVKLYVPYRAAADPERQPMLEVVLGPSFSKQHWQFLTQVAVSAAASCSDGGWAEAGASDMFGSPGSQMELLNELRKELMGHFGGFDSLFGAMPGFPAPQGGMDFAPPPDDMRPFSPPDQAGAGGGQKGIVQQLEKMGTQVVLPQANSQCDWGVLAGYEEQKQEIEQTILLALKQPELFDSVARGTRVHYKPNRPRAVLFEGPPGTGKTTSAKVIANQAAVPLIYLPLNSLMSKYYGESEQMLSRILSLADQLQGAIVFIDEIDSLALSRSGEMWEATRRLLAVLLAFIDGFDSKQRTLVIGATNRKSDLDAAMLSRFDVVIGFPIPDAACRHAILKQYAKHLKPEELQLLVDATDGCSGRDLRNLCEYAERRHTAAIYHSRAPASSLPSCKDYLAAAKRSGSGSRMAEGARDTDGSGRSERAALLSKLLPEMVR